MKKTLLYFISLSIFIDKRRVLSVAIPSIIFLSLIFCVTFIHTSIQYYYNSLLINTNKNPYIYARYYTSPRGEFFLLTSSSTVKDDRMIVGDGVANWLKNHYYKDSFNFISSGNGDLVKLKIDKVVKNSFIASDLIILSPNSIKAIFGDLKPRNIPYKHELFNYEGGFFKTIYLVAIVGFLMIFYLYYTQLKESYAKENRILLAVGWSKDFLMRFRLIESSFLAIFILILSLTLSYFYIFWFDAPLLKSIFFGVSNISSTFKLFPKIDIFLVGKIFISFFTIFLIVTLISLRQERLSPAEVATT
jgi:hypothetical protein